MAKKVRRRLEEEEAAAFEFPVFDEIAFVTKEFEMTGALVVATAIAVLLGILAWVGTVYGLGAYPLPLGVVGIALSPWLIRRVRPRSPTYTKGDWAGLLALEFFGYLALWFALVNVSPGAL